MTAAAATAVRRATLPLRLALRRQMHTTLVNVYCKPGSTPSVIAATLANCQSSTKEVGCVRFDLFQSASDENHLTIEEMYETPEAAAAHKETAHYLKWRDAVADAMAQPREGNGVNLLSAPSPAKTSEESETAVFRRALAAGGVAEAIALLQEKAPRTFLIHGRAIEENLKTHFGRERDRQRNDRQQRSTMIL